MADTAIRLLIADDHPVVREGIAGMFAGHSDFVVVGQAADGARAVELARTLTPDVVLMDLRMPVLDGFDAIRQILQAQPETKILVLTTYGSEQDVRAALKAGAAGYLLKDAPREQLYEAVRSAMQGKPTFSAEVVQQLLHHLHAPDDSLTEREIEVLALASRGFTNKAIGQHLHISEATVKTHLKHIYAKLNVPDRASAVAVALTRHIISAESDQL